jgi:hypothetical protein
MKKCLLAVIFLFVYADSFSYIFCPNSVTCNNQDCIAHSETFSNQKIYEKPLSNGTYYFSFTDANRSTSVGTKAICVYFNQLGEKVVGLATSLVISPELESVSSDWKRTSPDYSRFRCVPNYVFPYNGNPEKCPFKDGR